MTTTTTPGLNGVDTESLFATREAVKQAPAAAAFTLRATNRWISGAHSRSTIDGFFGVGEEQRRPQAFVLDADHPAHLHGTDNGPMPVELVLHALASCIVAGVASVAAAKGIALTKVEAKVEGDIDLQGVLGLDDDVRNGFGDIRIAVDVEGDASPEELRRVVERSRARSAVYDVLTGRTPVSIEVTAA